MSDIISELSERRLGALPPSVGALPGRGAAARTSEHASSSEETSVGSGVMSSIVLSTCGGFLKESKATYGLDDLNPLVLEHVLLKSIRSSLPDF